LDTISGINEPQQQLIVEQPQIFPFHRAASLDTIGVQRTDHGVLAARVSRHLGNSIVIPDQCTALGTRL
jgi:hypothetical protein